MNHHFRNYSRTFYNTTVRCKVTFQYCKTTCLAVRIIQWTDNFRIQVDTVFDILANSLTCYCHTFCMEKTFFVQFIHNSVNTACFVQVLHVCWTCWRQMAQIRSLFADLICKADIKIHSNFMSDCRQMKHTVGRTAKCHIYGQRIKNCFFCHDISWTDVSAVHFHNLHTCMFCKADTL